MPDPSKTKFSRRITGSHLDFQNAYPVRFAKEIFGKFFLGKSGNNPFADVSSSFQT